LTHTTREAARIVFRHGLRPATLAICGQHIGGGQAAPLSIGLEDVRWAAEYPAACATQPLSLARLAQEALALSLGRWATSRRRLLQLMTE
jgi:hypothetical protein